MVQCSSIWFNIVFRGKTTLNNFEQRKALLNNIEQTKRYIWDTNVYWLVCLT